MTPPGIRVKGLVKRFGAVAAVDGATFDVGPGEMVALLGPSGCGKTTTLRCIGGYDTPTFGDIEIAGNRINDLPMQKRDIGMVFQSYALFPHKTVADNVAFALKMRGIGKSDRMRQTSEVLDLVGMSGFETRYPAELSGGQRQRVAIARAIIHRPAVLLLDEPLANLDRKLRETMRQEIRGIQAKVGISAIFVTHDQEEALVMAHRVAVMEAGRIHQIGPPEEIYNRPATRFVARFIGTTNYIDATVRRFEAGIAMLTASDGRDFLVAGPKLDPGATVGLSVRPERIEIAASAPPDVPNRLRGTIATVSYLGASSLYAVTIGAGRTLQVLAPLQDGRPTFRVGDEVDAWWRPDRGYVVV